MATLPEILANEAAPGLVLPNELPNRLPNQLIDSHGRQITDLRVSITDRCNYKCVYCRTGQVGAQYAELSTDDYLRIIRNFVALGIEKVRLTGGEPLLRRDLTEMVQELATWRTPAGDKLDIAITTNGHLLEDLAAPLKKAGLSRVTVSMGRRRRPHLRAHHARPQQLQRRSPGHPRRPAGRLRPRQGQLRPPPRLQRTIRSRPSASSPGARTSSSASSNSCPSKKTALWSPEMVVPLREIVERLNKIHPIRQLAPNAASETARRYGFTDGVGEIGIIAPVTQAFCGACSRIRLTSDGKIRTCLFSHTEHDLNKIMREGAQIQICRSSSCVQFLERKHGTISASRDSSSPPLHGAYRRLSPLSCKAFSISMMA